MQKILSYTSRLARPPAPQSPVIPFTLSPSDSLPFPAINPITALNVTPAANSEQKIFSILLLIPDGIFAYLNKGTRARTGKKRPDHETGEGARGKRARTEAYNHKKRRETTSEIWDRTEDGGKNRSLDISTVDKVPTELHTQNRK